jgi:hypothetical protein
MDAPVAPRLANDAAWSGAAVDLSANFDDTVQI